MLMRRPYARRQRIATGQSIVSPEFQVRPVLPVAPTTPANRGSTFRAGSPRGCHFGKCATRFRTALVSETRLLPERRGGSGHRTCPCSESAGSVSIQDTRRRRRGRCHLLISDVLISDTHSLEGHKIGCPALSALSFLSRARVEKPWHWSLSSCEEQRSHAPPQRGELGTPTNLLISFIVHAHNTRARHSRFLGVSSFRVSRAFGCPELSGVPSFRVSRAFGCPELSRAFRLGHRLSESWVSGALPFTKSGCPELSIGIVDGRGQRLQRRATGRRVLGAGDTFGQHEMRRSWDTHKSTNPIHRPRPPRPTCLAFTKSGCPELSDLPGIHEIWVSRAFPSFQIWVSRAFSELSPSFPGIHEIWVSRAFPKSGCPELSRTSPFGKLGVRCSPSGALHALHARPAWHSRNLGVPSRASELPSRAFFSSRNLGVPSRAFFTKSGCPEPSSRAFKSGCPELSRAFSRAFPPSFPELSQVNAVLQFPTISLRPSITSVSSSGVERPSLVPIRSTERVRI